MENVRKIFRGLVRKKEPQIIMEIDGPKGHCILYGDVNRQNSNTINKQAEAIQLFMEFNNE